MEEGRGSAPAFCHTEHRPCTYLLISVVDNDGVAEVGEEGARRRGYGHGSVGDSTCRVGLLSKFRWGTTSTIPFSGTNVAICHSSPLDHWLQLVLRNWHTSIAAPAGGASF